MSYSVFMNEIFDKDGNLKERTVTHNLTTDSASTFINRRDFQSKAMGGGAYMFSTATLVGTATASSGTSLTNSGASFPTSGQGLSGAIVAAGPNGSGAGSTVFGMIQSNNGTILTVDQWYSAADGSVGSTPDAAAKYQVLPGAFPAPYIALSADATTPSSNDTSLASELTSNGFSRALATFAHTAAATTYTLTHTFTCTGGSTTINKEAICGSSVANKGVMPFESAVPSPPTLVSSDTLAVTCTITIN